MRNASTAGLEICLKADFEVISGIVPGRISMALLPILTFSSLAWGVVPGYVEIGRQPVLRTMNAVGAIFQARMTVA